MKGYRYLTGAGFESNCETALSYYRRGAGMVATTVRDRLKDTGSGGGLSVPSSGPTVVRIHLLE